MLLCNSRDNFNDFRRRAVVQWSFVLVKVNFVKMENMEYHVVHKRRMIKMLGVPSGVQNIF